VTRFIENDGWQDGPCITWEMWEYNVRRALSGRRGQEALAELERALVALPAPRLVRGHLAAQDQVCTVGALLAYRRAHDTGRGIEEVIADLSAEVPCQCGHDRSQHPDDTQCGHVTPEGQYDWELKPHPARTCECEVYEPYEDAQEELDTTKGVGVQLGLTKTMAEHLAYLNDEEFHSCTPEERYDRVLAYVRRAQGKSDATVVA
jgi:hypothetical protein